MEEDRLLLIFTRNPELGKCKTRLAATIGDRAALEIYRFLLLHTRAITRDLKAHKMVFYSDTLIENDLWDRNFYLKSIQEGNSLGDRMKQAFIKGFGLGYKNIIIIGSDMYDLKQADLEKAFQLLEENECVLGPASDGGYYLLGMKVLEPGIFKNKKWGENSVFTDTLNDLKHRQVALLPVKNDIDEYEDIKDNPAFYPFLNHSENDQKST